VTENSKKIGQRIKKLRKEIGMSQQDLAERFGVLRPTISQMENGERKVIAEELIKLSEILNTSVQYVMGLIDQPKIVLQERRAKMTKPQMRINVPAKNLDKFKEVLLYIFGKVGSKPNIGETAIYKLLYFIDFDYYEKHEEQLIGATYIKNTYGPTPREFRKIVDKMIEEKDISYPPADRGCSHIRNVRSTRPAGSAADRASRILTCCFEPRPSLRSPPERSLSIVRSTAGGPAEQCSTECPHPPRHNHGPADCVTQ
jgi:transcriptional regulator with XRE-family HTH domain